jgi:hypothetical protein
LDQECNVLKDVVNDGSSEAELGINPVKLPGVSEYITDSGSALVVKNSAVFIHLLEQNRKR